MAKQKKAKAPETKTVPQGGRTGYKRSTNKRINQLHQQLDRLKRKALNRAMYEKGFKQLNPTK